MNVRQHSRIHVTDIPYLVGMMIASVVLIMPLPSCNQTDDMVFHDPLDTSETDLPPLAGANQSPTFASANYASESRDDLGGYAVGRGFSIQWGQSGNADIAEVLDATIDRLTHLQHTNLASDKQARVLWDLTQAREKLDE